ncbi:hypothetical protein VaNZ11_005008, partial [Volvox africanus]
MDEFYCRACYNEEDLIACDACGACYHRRCVEAHCCGPPVRQPGSTAPKSNSQRTPYQLPPQFPGHGIDGHRSSAAAALVPNGARPPETVLSSNSDFTRPCLTIASEGFEEAALTSEEECPAHAADWFCPACRCVRCGRACCPIAVERGGNRLAAIQNACEGALGLHRHHGNPAVAANAASLCPPVAATGQHRGDAAQLAMWRVMTTRVIAQKVVPGAGADGRGAAIAAAVAVPPLFLEKCRALAASARSPVELEYRLDTEVALNPNRTPALNWPLQALLEALLPTEPWKGRRVALQLLAAALFKTMHNDKPQQLKRQQLPEEGHSRRPTEPMLKRRRIADGNKGAVAATAAVMATAAATATATVAVTATATVAVTAATVVGTSADAAAREERVTSPGLIPAPPPRPLSAQSMDQPQPAAAASGAAARAAAVAVEKEWQGPHSAAVAVAAAAMPSGLWIREGRGPFLPDRIAATKTSSARSSASASAVKGSSPGALVGRKEQSSSSHPHECSSLRFRNRGAAAAMLTAADGEAGAATIASSAATAAPLQPQVLPARNPGYGGSTGSIPPLPWPHTPHAAMNPAAIFAPAFTAALAAAITTGGGPAGSSLVMMSPGQMVALTAFLHRRTELLKQQLQQLQQQQQQQNQQRQQQQQQPEAQPQQQQQPPQQQQQQPPQQQQQQQPQQPLPQPEAQPQQPVPQQQQQQQPEAQPQQPLPQQQQQQQQQAQPHDVHEPKQPHESRLPSLPPPLSKQQQQQEGMAKIRTLASFPVASCPSAPSQSASQESSAGPVALAPGPAPAPAPVPEPGAKAAEHGRAAAHPSPAVAVSKPRLSVTERLQLVQQRKAQGAARRRGTLRPGSQGQIASVMSLAGASGRMAGMKRPIGSVYVTTQMVDEDLSAFLDTGDCVGSTGASNVNAAGKMGTEAAGTAPLEASAGANPNNTAVPALAAPVEALQPRQSLLIPSLHEEEPLPLLSPVALLPPPLPPLPSSLQPSSSSYKPARNGAPPEWAGVLGSAPEVDTGDLSVRAPNHHHQHQHQQQQHQQREQQSATMASEVLSALALLQALPPPAAAPASPLAAAVPEQPSPSAASHPTASTIVVHETLNPTSTSAVHEIQEAIGNAAANPPHVTLQYDFVCAVRCICCSRPCHVGCLAGGEAAGAEGKWHHQAGNQELAATHGSNPQPLLRPSHLTTLCPNGEVPWVSTAPTPPPPPPSLHRPPGNSGLQRPHNRAGDPHGVVKQNAERQADAVAPAWESSRVPKAVGNGEFICGSECRALMRALQQLRQEGCRRLELDCKGEVLLGPGGRSSSLEWQLVALWPPGGCSSAGVSSVDDDVAGGGGGGGGGGSNGGNGPGGEEAVATGTSSAAGSGAMDLTAAMVYDPRTIQQDLEVCMGVFADGTAAAAVSSPSPSPPPPPVAALDPAWRSAGGLLGGLSWAPATGVNRSDGEGEGEGEGAADARSGRSIQGTERDRNGGGGNGVQLAALLWVEERVGGVVLVHVYGPSLAVVHVPAVHPRFGSYGPNLGALLLCTLESALSHAGVRTVLLGLTPAAAYGVVASRPKLLCKRRGRQPRLSYAEAEARASAAVAAAAATWLDGLGYTPADAAVLTAVAVAHAPKLPPPSALLSARDPRCDPPGPSCAQPVGRVLYYKHLRPVAVADAAAPAAAGAAASAVPPPPLPTSPPDVARSAAALPDASLFPVLEPLVDQEEALRPDVTVALLNGLPTRSAAHVVAPTPMELPYDAAPHRLMEPSGRNAPAAESPFACPTAAAYVACHMETPEAEAAIPAAVEVAVAETGLEAVATETSALGALAPSQPLTTIASECATTSGAFHGFPFPDGSGSFRTIDTYGTPYGLELATLMCSPDSLLLVSGVNLTTPAAPHHASAPSAAPTTTAAVDPAAMDGGAFGATHGSMRHPGSAAEEHVLESITAAASAGVQDQLPPSSIIGEIIRTYFEALPAPPPAPPPPLPLPSLPPQLPELSFEHQTLTEGKSRRRAEEARISVYDEEAEGAAQLERQTQVEVQVQVQVQEAEEEFRQHSISSEEAAQFEQTAQSFNLLLGGEQPGQMAQLSPSTPHLDAPLAHSDETAPPGPPAHSDEWASRREAGAQAEVEPEGAALQRAEGWWVLGDARREDQESHGEEADHLQPPQVMPPLEPPPPSVKYPRRLGLSQVHAQSQVMPGRVGHSEDVPTQPGEGGQLLRHVQMAVEGEDRLRKDVHVATTAAAPPPPGEGLPPAAVDGTAVTDVAFAVAEGGILAAAAAATADEAAVPTADGVDAMDRAVLADAADAAGECANRDGVNGAANGGVRTIDGVARTAYGTAAYNAATTADGIVVMADVTDAGGAIRTAEVTDAGGAVRTVEVTDAGGAVRTVEVTDAGGAVRTVEGTDAGGAVRTADVTDAGGAARTVEGTDAGGAVRTVEGTDAGGAVRTADVTDAGGAVRTVEGTDAGGAARTVEGTDAGGAVRTADVTDAGGAVRTADVTDAGGAVRTAEVTDAGGAVRTVEGTDAGGAVRTVEVTDAGGAVRTADVTDAGGAARTVEGTDAGGAVRTVEVTDAGGAVRTADVTDAGGAVRTVEGTDAGGAARTVEGTDAGGAVRTADVTDAGGAVRTADVTDAGGAVRTAEVTDAGGAVRTVEGTDAGGAVRTVEGTDAGGAVRTVEGTDAGGAVRTAEVTDAGGAIRTAEVTDAGGAVRAADGTATGGSADGTAAHLNLPAIPDSTRSAAGVVAAPSIKGGFEDGGSAPETAGPAANTPAAVGVAGEFVRAAEAPEDTRRTHGVMNQDIDAAPSGEIAAAEANPAAESLTAANCDREVGLATAAAAAIAGVTAPEVVSMAAAAAVVALRSNLRGSPIKEAGGAQRPHIQSLSREGSDAVLPVMSGSTGSVVLCGNGSTVADVAVDAVPERRKRGTENAAASGAAGKLAPWALSNTHHLHQLPASSVVRGRSAVRNIVPEPSGGEGGGGSTSAETSSSQRAEAVAPLAEVAAAAEVGRSTVAAAAPAAVVTAAAPALEGPCEKDALRQRSSRTTSPAASLAVNNRGNVTVVEAEITYGGDKVGGADGNAGGVVHDVEGSGGGAAATVAAAARIGCSGSSAPSVAAVAVGPVAPPGSEGNPHLAIQSCFSPKTGLPPHFMSSVLRRDPDVDGYGGGRVNPKPHAHGRFSEALAPTGTKAEAKTDPRGVAAGDGAGSLGMDVGAGSMPRPRPTTLATRWAGMSQHVSCLKDLQQQRRQQEAVGEQDLEVFREEQAGSWRRRRVQWRQEDRHDGQVRRASRSPRRGRDGCHSPSPRVRDNGEKNGQRWRSRSP